MKVNFFNQPYLLHGDNCRNIRGSHILSVSEIPIGAAINRDYNVWIDVFLVHCLVDWEKDWV